MRLAFCDAAPRAADAERARAAARAAGRPAAQAGCAVSAKEAIVFAAVRGVMRAREKTGLQRCGTPAEAVLFLSFCVKEG